MHILRIGLVLMALAIAMPAWAQQADGPAAQEPESTEPGEPDRAATEARLEATLRSLDFKEGTFPLHEGLATIATTPGMRYLVPADAEIFLTQLWGNPPGAGRRSLGMLVPVDKDIFSAEGWAAVISWNERGYVPDGDAESIDYDGLLKDMQDDARENNKRRITQGYQPVELVGWARPPHYDKAGKTLYWAKRLRFGDDEHETLNYVINILGRRGVLELNIVSSMEALPDVDSHAQAILETISFTSGNTYADYVPSMDKVAEVGIAGLIAGGVLAKTSLLKGILLFILAFKKAVIAGALVLLSGVWVAVKRLFRR